MKHAVSIALILCLLLSGCDNWMDGSYVSITPHKEQQTPSEQGVVAISNMLELRSALEDMVERGETSRILSVEAYPKESLDSGIATAIHYITRISPVGAYAVDQIQCEQGTSGAMSAVAVTITYHYSRGQIQRIKHTRGIEEAKRVIETALDQCEAGVVLKIEDYTDTDFLQMIEDYADTSPEKVMEVPQVTANIYPDSGSERVVELIFTYQTSREALRNMQSYVQPVFSAASLYVSGDVADSVKFSQMYAFLMERYDYKVETSITPAYSLLRHGVGDCKAFAVVYAAMCRGAGLDCQVVSGTRMGQPWFWNIICDDGAYYHVDLLQSSPVGKLQRRTDAQMQGYVWDYSAYPGCGTEADDTEPIG